MKRLSGEIAMVLLQVDRVFFFGGGGWSRVLVMVLLEEVKS
jgi:hypothetical protein